MILCINAIRNPEERRQFDTLVVPRLLTVAPADFDVVHLVEHPLPDDLAPYSHLLISGSELSAAERYPTDDGLLRTIRGFVDASKPVLGICYGHQMVARALLGDAACRRAAVPEFGWKRLRNLQPNPLFDGLDDVVTIHSHYDEVTGLDDRFEVLASTDDCTVQAFQVRGLPVWGVQFHPELDHAGGERMLRSNLDSEPRAAALAGNDLDRPEQADANLRMFANFFRAQAVRAVA